MDTTQRPLPTKKKLGHSQTFIKKTFPTNNVKNVFTVQSPTMRIKYPIINIVESQYYKDDKLHSRHSPVLSFGIAYKQIWSVPMDVKACTGQVQNPVPFFCRADSLINKPPQRYPHILYQKVESDPSFKTMWSAVMH